MELVWLIPALPVAGFVLLLAFGKRLGDPIAGIVGTLAVAGSFLVSCVVALDLMAQPDVYLEGGDHERLLHIQTRYLRELFGDAPHCRFSQPRMQHVQA